MIQPVEWYERTRSSKFQDYFFQFSWNQNATSSISKELKLIRTEVVPRRKSCSFMTSTKFEPNLTGKELVEFDKKLLFMQLPMLNVKIAVLKSDK